MATEATKPQAQAQTAEVKPVVEKQTNCPACNKPLKKIKRYYRNGKFYCNKRCWIKATKANEKKEDNAK
ncbi:MAG: hypothetical protein WC510_00065 [Candidatus Omnitrophota bacterium]